MDLPEALSGLKQKSENEPFELNGSICLSTFSLTELVYEVLSHIKDAYLRVNLVEAELVVLRSDKKLLSLALLHSLNELLRYSSKQGIKALINIQVKRQKGMGYLELDCPEIDLTDLSIRTGKNALTLTGNNEASFEFVIARTALAKVKASMRINHNRKGGSSVVFEIPKVRGEAS